MSNGNIRGISITKAYNIFTLWWMNPVSLPHTCHELWSTTIGATIFCCNESSNFDIDKPCSYENSNNKATIAWIVCILLLGICTRTVVEEDKRKTSSKSYSRRTGCSSKQRKELAITVAWICAKSLQQSLRSTQLTTTQTMCYMQNPMKYNWRNLMQNQSWDAIGVIYKLQRWRLPSSCYCPLPTRSCCIGLKLSHPLYVNLPS